MAEYMDDASKFGTFHKDIAKLIDSYCENKDSIIDAGCGIGALSLELSNYFGEVISVDNNEAPLKMLKSNIKDLNKSNIKIICSDINSLKLSKKISNALFCFFGDLDFVLDFAKENCTGKVIVISRLWEEYRFSLDKKAHNRKSGKNYEQILKSKNIPYEKILKQYDMGQPLRNEKEAIDFFRLYSKDDNKSEVVFDDIKDKLELIENKEYQYYFPVNKEISIIIIDARDIK